MIIDYQANPGHAALYDMIDTATGRSMADRSVFYADDATGIFRVYLRDANGNFLTRKNHFGVSAVAWEERRGTFRLVLKAQVAGSPASPERAETWRDRKSLL